MKTGNLTLINDFILKSEFYQELSSWFDQTAGFLLLLFGLFGNMCVLYLMKSKKLWTLAISVYLITLAISDTIALLFENLIMFLDLVNSKLSIQQATECKIYYFNLVARLVSAWTVVNISLDRFVSVYYPKKNPRFLNKKSCIIRVVVIVATSILLTLHYLVIIKAPTNFRYDCYAYDELWYEEIWPTIYMILYSVIPSVLITTFNSLIIHKTLKSKSNLNKITNDPTMSSIPSRHKKTTAHHSSKKLNLTVIFICVSFVLLTLPASIFNIATVDELATGDQYSNASLMNLDYQAKRFEIIHLTFIRRMFEYLMDVNNAINFYIYVLSSNLFRHEFFLLLKLKFNGNLTKNTRTIALGANTLR